MHSVLRYILRSAFEFSKISQVKVTGLSAPRRSNLSKIFVSSTRTTLVNSCQRNSMYLSSLVVTIYFIFCYNLISSLFTSFFLFSNWSKLWLAWSPSLSRLFTLFSSANSFIMCVFTSLISVDISVIPLKLLVWHSLVPISQESALEHWCLILLISFYRAFGITIILLSNGYLPPAIFENRLVVVEFLLLKARDSLGYLWDTKLLLFCIVAWALFVKSNGWY